MCKLLEFFVNAILFYDEKDHFKQKLLLWPYVHFKNQRSGSKTVWDISIVFVFRGIMMF